MDSKAVVGALVGGIVALGCGAAPDGGQPEGMGVEDSAIDSPIGEAKAAINATKNFRIFLRAAFRDPNTRQWTYEAPRRSPYIFGSSSGQAWTPWSNASSRPDPDGLVIGLERSADDAFQYMDFRIGLAGDDNDGKINPINIQWTPWASDGGGPSGFATDADGRNPDYYVAIIEERLWPVNTQPKKLTDFAVGIMGWEHCNDPLYGCAYNPKTYTFSPYIMSSVTSPSALGATGTNSPDAYSIYLKVYLTN